MNDPTVRRRSFRNAHLASKKRGIGRIAGALLVIGCTLALAPNGARAQAVPNDCVVTDWSISRAVQSRRPSVDRRDFIPSDARVYAFVSLNCTRLTDRHVVFDFWRNGNEYARIPLSIAPSSRYRTWASVAARPGDWEIRLLLDDLPIITDSFQVHPAEPPATQ